MSNVLEFIIRAKDLTANSFSNLSSRLKKLKSNLSGFTSSIGKWAKRGALAFLGWSVASVKFAMNAEEMEDKLVNMFGTLGEEASKFSVQLARSFGVSQGSMKAMITEAGQLAQALGMTGQEALDFSKDITQLTYDLGAFKKIDPKEVFDAIKKGVAGSSRPLKALGVIFEEGEVAQKAVAFGYAKTTKAISVQAKALTILKLIHERSTEAQGAAIEEAKGLTGRFITLRASIYDLGVEYGTQMAKGLGLGEIFSGLAKKIYELTEKIKESKSVQTFFENLSKTISPIGALFDSLIKGDFEGAGKAWNKFADNIRVKFTEVKQFILAKFKELSESAELKAFAAKVGDSLSKAVTEGVVNAAKAIAKMIIPVYYKFVNVASDWVGEKIASKPALANLIGGEGVEVNRQVKALKEQVDRLQSKIIKSTSDPIRGNIIAQKYGLTQNEQNRALSFKSKIASGELGYKELNTPGAAELIEETNRILRELPNKLGASE